MMVSRSKALGVVGGLLAGLVLGAALAALSSATRPAMARQAEKPATPRPAPPGPQDAGNKALAEEQLKLARLALQELDAQFKNARIDSLDSTAALWERRQIEAIKASGVGKGELVPALERYVVRMKYFHQVAEARLESARATHLSVLDWQYRALEGEIWLNEARSR